MLAIVAFLVLADASWQEVSRSDAVTVYRRPHAAGGLTETLSVGTVDAPPWVVKNALDDYDPKVGQMPYMAETKVLKRDERGAVIYNRTSPPLVDDRDYTIRMFDDSFVNEEGAIVYVARWKTANAEGPPPREGVVRVEKTEGYWRLDPVDGGKRTKASYFVVASPGGSLPQSIADWGTNTVMEGIFDAVRARAKQKTYREKLPPSPTRSQ